MINQQLQLEKDPNNGSGWQKQASRAYKMNKVSYEGIDNYNTFMHINSAIDGTYDEFNK